MQNLNKKIAPIIQNLNLGEINETKKLSILDEIGETLSYRIITRLVAETEEVKRELFIQKINENKNNPDKILLFIDHFITNADEIIDEEIKKYKNELQKITKSQTTKN